MAFRLRVKNVKEIEAASCAVRDVNDLHRTFQLNMWHPFEHPCHREM